MGISVYRKNTLTLELNCTDAEGDPADLTGYVVLFSVKAEDSCTGSADDSDAIIKGEFIMADPPTALPQGTYEISAEETDVTPGNYLIDTKYFFEGKEINSDSENFIVKAPGTNRGIPDVS